MKQTICISEAGQQVVRDFIETLAGHEDLDPKTLKEYAGDLRHFITWFEFSGHEDGIIFHMDDVSTPTLMRYRDAMQKDMKLKPATINRRLITLKRFFQWIVSASILSRDPSRPIKLIPEEKVSPRQMTDKEESTLIAAVERSGSLRDQTILILMLHTGLRTMEVCDLAPGDVQFSKRSGQLTVRAGKRSKHREIPLNSTCRAALARYMATLSDCPYLFPSEKTGHRLTERALRYLIQKYMREARLTGLSAHDLRHRFGYVMAKNTPLHRLAQIMGHDSLDTTMIYVKAICKPKSKKLLGDKR